MENVSDWIVTLAAVAVGVGSALAVLSTRSIARLLHRVLLSRPKVAPQLGLEPTCEEAAGVTPSPGWRPDRVLTASTLDS
jgi:hypothetical protein